MRGLTSFLMAFLIEVLSHRHLHPLAAARTVVFHLDRNTRLLENTLQIHCLQRLPALPRTPYGHEVAADLWNDWTPQGPLLPLLKAAIDSANHHQPRTPRSDRPLSLP